MHERNARAAGGFPDGGTVRARRAGRASFSVRAFFSALTASMKSEPRLGSSGRLLAGEPPFGTFFSACAQRFKGEA